MKHLIVSQLPFWKKIFITSTTRKSCTCPWHTGFNYAKINWLPDVLPTCRNLNISKSFNDSLFFTNYWMILLWKLKNYLELESKWTFSYLSNSDCYFLENNENRSLNFKKLHDQVSYIFPFNLIRNNWHWKPLKQFK